MLNNSEMMGERDTRSGRELKQPNFVYTQKVSGTHKILQVDRTGAKPWSGWRVPVHM